MSYTEIEERNLRTVRWFFSEEEGGRMLGHVRDVLDYPANDVLELDTGLALPLVEACVRKVDVEGGRIVIAPGFAHHE